MGVQVVFVDQQISDLEEFRYKDEAGFFETVRRSATTALADKILREAARFQKIAPKKGDPNPVFRYVWSLGVERDLTEVEARERQMDDARRKGLREAAEMLREDAAKFDRVSGPCKHVLQSTLRGAAKRIEAVSTAFAY